jgi:hypothetical protein
MHTVIAADPNGVPIRVACGYCSSEHNYRGGPRMAVGSDADADADAELKFRAPQFRAPARASAARQVKSDRAFPIVSDRERVAPPIPMTDTTDLELLLRRIVREESGVTAVVPAERWRGGTLVLKPGNATQEKSWPIETFFHKVVMIRNRLRSLEQQVNAMDTPEDVKVKLQSYISGCYGSLTSFNILFADEDDQFKGSSGD